MSNPYEGAIRLLKTRLISRGPGSERQELARAIHTLSVVAKMDGAAKLSAVIQILEGAERIGREKDDPEGVKYIQISDTLVRQMVPYLKELEVIFK